jgi:hypothetical protein
MRKRSFPLFTIVDICYFKVIAIYMLKFWQKKQKTMPLLLRYCDDGMLFPVFYFIYPTKSKVNDRA